MLREVATATVLAAVMPWPLSAQEPHPAARTARLTTARIARLATPSTVTIVTLGADGDTLGQGSGFVIRRDGVIVTNWHVLTGAANAIVVMDNGERYDRVRFVDGDSSADIALLRVPGYDLPVLRTRSQVPSPGERVVVLGSPMGLARSVTDGIVSATRVVAGKQLVQITAAISPGSSGGPVLDASGRVFAVSTFYLEGGQQLNFAVPVRYALGMLSSPIRERALSEVFGVAASSGAVSSAAPGAAAPARARLTRTSVQGVYYAHQSSSMRGGTGRPVRSQGWLLSAEEQVGLFALQLLDSSGVGIDRWYVFYVQDLRTGADGEVVLSSGGVVYQGYQTDGGLFLRGLDKAYQYTLAANSQSIPPSDNTGLYNVQTRTFYHGSSGYVSETPTDWTGTAAIVTTPDSIFVDLMLRNAAGGSSEFTARGARFTDGSFQLLMRSPGQPSSLNGSIRAGRFSGQWTDQRSDGVYYTGHIEGVRY